MLKIGMASVFVEDQEKALKFYTETLGFVKKMDVPTGDYRWLTVTDELGQFELLLEPNVHPAAKAYQKAIFKDNIPATSLMVDDIDKEYERLMAKGVRFVVPPTKMEWGMYAIFDDTCGNLINIA